MTDDERAIRELVDTWMVASKAGDVSTVLSLMTDDVVFMVPGQEPFGEGEMPSGEKMVAVNARCLEGVDTASLSVNPFDGHSL